MTPDIDFLAASVAARRRVLDSAAGSARATVLRGKALETEIATLGVEVATLDRVATLLNSLGDTRQSDARATIESLVTMGLQTIFGPELSFHVVSTTRAKTSGVEFMVRSNLDSGPVDTPVLDARGGGLAATCGFLLRVVVLLLGSAQRGERLLCLDESFAMVSEEYLPRVSEFLRTLVDRTGIQVLMVTHSHIFEENADVVYRFDQVAGRTRAVRA